jgi:hypothetical protein
MFLSYLGKPLNYVANLCLNRISGILPKHYGEGVMFLLFTEKHLSLRNNQVTARQNNQVFARWQHQGLI